MATAGTLTYTFKADVSDLKAKTAEMSASLKAAGNAARASAEQVQSGMQASLKAMNDNTAGIKLNSNSWMILGGAVRHGIDALISGQSPMRVLTVEGIKASAAVGGISAGMLAVGGTVAAAVAAIGIAISTVKAWGEEYQALGRTAKITGESIALVAKQQQIADQTPGNNGYDVSKGITEFAVKLREAQVVGGKLADMMSRIGIPLKDAAGKARDLQSILQDVAKAIADGSNEADKMHLVERLGLGQESIPWLESYAAKLRDGTAAVTDADKALIELKREAAQFDEEWAKAWHSFEDNAKAAALNALHYWRQSSDEMKLAIKVAMAPLMAPISVGGYLGQKAGEAINGTVAAKSSVNQLDQAFAVAAEHPFGKLDVTSITKAASKRDLSGTWDPEKAKQQRKTPGFNMVSTYDKQVQGLKAQVAAFNESYAAQTRDVELAKYDTEVSDKLAEMRKNGVKITKQMTDSIAAQREKLIGLTQDYAKFEMQKTQLEGIRDSWKELGDGVANAIDDIAVKGGKLQDVMKSLAQSLASSALKGLLTGEGAFGKAFGLANPTGGLGGLLGGLFGGARASGGAVEAGKTYRVGEHGEEWFKPNTSGSIIPHDQVATAGADGGAAGGAPVFHIDARGADAAAVARLERVVAGIQSNFGKNVMGVMSVAQTRRVSV